MNVRKAVTAAVISSLLAIPVPAQQTQPDDLQSIRTELEALRKAQDAIQKDLQEIKTLLRTRAAAPRKVDPADMKITLDGEPVRGSSTARVVLIEFSDYQCPFCQRVVREALPAIDKDYIRTGKIRHVFKDLPLQNIHANAFKAAVASECAREQGKFWEMHEKLFENGKQLGPDQLPLYAEAVGLDATKFRECVASGRFDEEIRGDMREANAAGITGTPSFLIGRVDGNGRLTIATALSGAQPAEAFKSAIDAVIATEK